MPNAQSPNEHNESHFTPHDDFTITGVPKECVAKFIFADDSPRRVMEFYGDLQGRDLHGLPQHVVRTFVDCLLFHLAMECQFASQVDSLACERAARHAVNDLPKPFGRPTTRCRRQVLVWTKRELTLDLMPNHVGCAIQRTGETCQSCDHASELPNDRRSEPWPALNPLGEMMLAMLAAETETAQAG